MDLNCFGNGIFRKALKLFRQERKTIRSPSLDNRWRVQETPSSSWLIHRDIATNLYDRLLIQTSVSYFRDFYHMQTQTRFRKLRELYTSPKESFISLIKPGKWQTNGKKMLKIAWNLLGNVRTFQLWLHLRHFFALLSLLQSWDFISFSLSHFLSHKLMIFFSLNLSYIWFP